MADRERRLVFTGNGKGKTTAALGMVLRAAGHDIRALVVQFVKGDRRSGEYEALRHLPGAEIERYGLGFVPERSGATFENHREAAARGLERAAEAMGSGEYGLVVLDEVCVAIDRGLLETPDVVDCVRGAACTVVMTGRHCPTELIELADTVTRMIPLKHGLNSGFQAQKGVEL